MKSRPLIQPEHRVVPLCEPAHRGSYRPGETFAFTYGAVQGKAPTVSGVYAIYTSQRWVYVGESDNIRQSLFGHLNDAGPSLGRFGPLSFSFELVSQAERVSRQRTLVDELAPACCLDQA